MPKRLTEDSTGGEFQTIPGRREKALYGMRNGGFEVVGLVTLSLASCLHQCDPITIWVWNRRTDYRQPKEENGVSRDPERSRKARLKIELPYCHYLGVGVGRCSTMRGEPLEGRWRLGAGWTWWMGAFDVMG
jgi:hypothetical protein